MKKQLSCIDCAVKSCQKGDGRYPDFCVTTHLDPQTLKDALTCYEEEENHRATLAAIFREHGFEVFGVCCKAGAVPKTGLGIDEKCSAVGKVACNPILQAKVLNEAKTDLNVVVGLCVGHDSLFYKYSDALVTTAVTKDRVLGHNPVAALYTANSYYGKLLGKEGESI